MQNYLICLPPSSISKFSFALFATFCWWIRRLSRAGIQSATDAVALDAPVGAARSFTRKSSLTQKEISSCKYFFRNFGLRIFLSEEMRSSKSSPPRANLARTWSNFSTVIRARDFCWKKHWNWTNSSKYQVISLSPKWPQNRLFRALPSKNQGAPFQCARRFPPWRNLRERVFGLRPNSRFWLGTSCWSFSRTKWMYVSPRKIDVF